MDEGFSTNAADFLIARKQKIRFNCRLFISIDKRVNSATIITANSLWTHQNISVGTETNVTDGLFVNGVQMSDQQNRSDTFNENKVIFTVDGFTFVGIEQ